MEERLLHLEPGFQAKLRERSRLRCEAEGISADDISYIKSIDFSLFKGEEASISSESLDRLRAVCQHWDVTLRPVNFTSHRRFVGPVIITLKRLLFPILSAFFKDTLREQRLYNAQVIRFLAHLAKEKNCTHHGDGNGKAGG